MSADVSKPDLGAEPPQLRNTTKVIGVYCNAHSQSAFIIGHMNEVEYQGGPVSTTC